MQPVIRAAQRPLSAPLVTAFTAWTGREKKGEKYRPGGLFLANYSALTIVYRWRFEERVAIKSLASRLIKESKYFCFISPQGVQAQNLWASVAAGLAYRILNEFKIHILYSKKVSAEAWKVF